MQLGTRFWMLAALVLGLACPQWVAAQNDSDTSPPPARYTEIVLADQPVLYFPFDAAAGKAAQPHPQSSAAAQVKAVASAGKVKLSVEGPTADRFPLFAADNTLMFFEDGKKAIVDLVAAVKENE